MFSAKAIPTFVFAAAIAATSALAQVPPVAPAETIEASHGSPWTDALLNAENKVDAATRLVQVSELENAIAELSALTGSGSALEGAQLGIAQRLLADAMVDLADRNFGAAPYETAIELYDTSMSNIDKQLYPEEWLIAWNAAMTARIAYAEQSDRNDEFPSLIVELEEMATPELRQSNPVGWARTMLELSAVHADAFYADPGAFEHFSAGVSAANDALEILSPTGTPDEWAAGHASLGGLYLFRAMGFGDRDYFQQAFEEFSTTQMAWIKPSNPKLWAQMLYLRGMASSGISDQLQAAEDDFETATKTLTATDTPRYWFNAKFYRLAMLSQQSLRERDTIALGRELVNGMPANVPEYTQISMYVLLANAILENNVLTNSQNDLKFAQSVLEQAKLLAASMDECDLSPAIDYQLARIEDLIQPGDGVA